MADSHGILEKVAKGISKSPIGPLLSPVVRPGSTLLTDVGKDPRARRVLDTYLAHDPHTRFIPVQLRRKAQNIILGPVNGAEDSKSNTGGSRDGYSQLDENPSESQLGRLSSIEITDKYIEPTGRPQKDPNIMKYGRLSSIAYHAPNERQVMIRQYLPGFTVETNCQTPEHFLVYNEAEKEGILVFRGTVISQRSDRIADVKIAFGDESRSQRFRKAVKFSRNAQSYCDKRWGTDEYSMTCCGHSLGGALAWFVAKSLNFAAYTFNIGIGFGAVKNILGLVSRYGLDAIASVDSEEFMRLQDSTVPHVHYVITGDPISSSMGLLEQFGQQIRSAPGVVKTSDQKIDIRNHYMDNFLQGGKKVNKTRKSKNSGRKNSQTSKKRKNKK